MKALRKPVVMAEFEDPEALLKAARAMKARGFELEDAYTPCKVEGMEELLDLGRSRLPWLVLAAGLTGAILAYLFQWWINVVDFPLNVGGRPLHAGPAFIPITFETGILWGASAGFIAFFVVGGMPKLWDPVFEVEGFDRASVDRYWLAVVEPADDWEGRLPADVLTELGALRVERPPAGNVAEASPAERVDLARRGKTPAAESGQGETDPGGRKEES